MPDAKLNRQRLRDHFRRLWLVYLLGLIALCFLNNLVYTVTRPRISDDELLKVMLLNVEADFPDAFSAELLEEVQAADLGVLGVEFVPIAAAGEDPTSQMLLFVQLTGGFGDIYITDETGLALLAERRACYPLEDVHAAGTELSECLDPDTRERYNAALTLEGSGLGGRVYLIAARNSTDIETTLAALPVLAAALME